MQVIHFVIHILIICLGYIYRTLAKWYLLSCSHCLVFFYSSKCPPPAPMHFTALAFMPIIALLIMQGQSVPPKKWAAKTARSAGREFLAPLLLWNSIARKDRWGWLNCSLGGIFVLESLSWAKEYHIKLEKQQNNLGQTHHMYSHIYLLAPSGALIAIPTYYWPSTSTTTTPLFQITPVLNTGLSLSEPLQLYKGYNAI